MAGVDMCLDGCLHPSSFQIFFFLVNKTPESHRFHAVRGVRVGLAPPLNAPADFRPQSDMSESFSKRHKRKKGDWLNIARNRSSHMRAGL